MFKIINKLDRSSLVEGRYFGLGFGFAKRKDDTVELVTPISCCKDYLSDQVFSEHTDKPYEVYGLRTTKTGCMDNGETVLVMRIEKYKHGGDYPAYASDVERLDLRYRHAELIVNRFEKELQKLNPDLKLLTKIEKCGEYYVVIADAWWGKYMYRISLLSLAIRVVIEAKHDLPSVVEYFEKCCDTNGYMTKQALPKVKRLLEKAAPDQAYKDPHSNGICGFQF